MRILVTGSSGFIGSHLTSLLSQQGHEVIGFDRKPSAEAFGVSKFVAGDLLHPTELVEAMRGVDCVIHLAAIHFDFGHADHEYFDTNERGTGLLLGAMDQAGVKKLIFASTIAVYGDRIDESDEMTPPAPSRAYGASKLAGEKLVHNWVDADKSHAGVIVRPCAVYGERNITNMNNLIRQIHSGYFMLFGAGENIKATAYVGNLVDAIAFLLSTLQPGIETYNYADKPDLSVLEIVQIIRRALGKPSRPPRCPLWLGVLASLPFEWFTRLTGKNLPVSTARVKKLALPTRVAASRIRERGFVQQVTTEAGLQRMVRYFLDHRQENS